MKLLGKKKPCIAVLKALGYLFYFILFYYNPGCIRKNTVTFSCFMVVK